MRQPVILVGPTQREYAHSLIDQAAPGSVVTLAKPARSTVQNKKLWAMLADVSRSEPEGRKWTQDTWKSAFMSYCGHAVQFCHGIDGGQPFPMGFKSSQLTITECAELITCILEYGDRHGVHWKEAKRGGFFESAT